jgi:hypothetical protein
MEVGQGQNSSSSAKWGKNSVVLYQIKPVMCSIGLKSALILVGGSRVITAYSVLFCYGFTTLYWVLVLFFSFLIYTDSVGILELGISPSQCRYLHTERYEHRINADTYPCLEWDSNPRPQKTVYAIEREATIIGLAIATTVHYWPLNDRPVVSTGNIFGVRGCNFPV